MPPPWRGQASTAFGSAIAGPFVVQEISSTCSSSSSSEEEEDEEMPDWDAESDCWNTRKSEVKSEEVGGCADNPPPPTAADRDLRTSGGFRPMSGSATAGPQ